MLILGVDPSLAHTGWAVIDQDEQVVKTGLLDMPKEIKLRPCQLQYIMCEIGVELHRYRPDIVVIERAAQWPRANEGTSTITLRAMIQVEAAVLIACGQEGRKVEFIEPAAVKEGLARSRYASKAAVRISLVLQGFDVERLSEHEVDALAAAVVYKRLQEVKEMADNG